MILRLLESVIETLNSQDIAYCHWHSTFYLHEDPVEIRDVELLVACQDTQRFESTLAALNFKRIVDPLQSFTPGIVHFYGLDDDTNNLVHLHVSYQVMTGESVLKNQCLPIEEPVLQNPRFERFSFLSALILRATRITRLMYRHLRVKGKSKQFASGGIVIAFVGPEATGKSTLVGDTARWLGSEFDVSSAHLGKPPSTWLTFLPNLALPLLRRVTPKYRTSRVENDSAAYNSVSVSLLYACRSVLVAWDRRALAIKLYQKAANGSIVICDRYPSTVVGAMDSPRLIEQRANHWRGKLLGYLARIERTIYMQIPSPDVVIRLVVPLEIAIERNKSRQKKGKEGDLYVTRRHRLAMIPSFQNSKTIELDVNQSLPQTINCARRILWNVL